MSSFAFPRVSSSFLPDFVVLVVDVAVAAAEEVGEGGGRPGHTRQKGGVGIVRSGQN